jgi:tetratricopeptide (TPR) repeat protein
VRLTSAKEEQQWQEFKNHLEWAELFSLIIFFVADDSLADVFRTRLYHQQKGHVSALKILKPENPETLTSDFFFTLETKIIPEIKVPLWLELNQRSDDWDSARDNFFARLNEYRDHLRHKFPYPIVILVPLNYKSRLRDIAPDLWSVRSFTDELVSAAFDSPSVASNNTSRRQSYDFKSKSSDAIELVEWQRTQTQAVSDYEQLQVGWRAFNTAFKLGDRALAEEIVNICLSIVRQQIENSTDESDYLRYLTAFLDRKGDLYSALGRREAAFELYQESLTISRRLLETLGETPETLRDLSVSLDNVGQQENALGRKMEANKHLCECLHLLQRLHAAFPKDQEFVTMIGEIEKIVGLAVAK